MTAPALTSVEVHGIPPTIEGEICEGLICESYVYQDETVSTANVTYLKIKGCWYRFCIDYPDLFWRTCGEVPIPWEVETEGWKYQHTDISMVSGTLGETIIGFEVTATLSGCKVTFCFPGGRAISIVNNDDVSSYVII